MAQKMVANFRRSLSYSNHPTSSSSSSSSSSSRSPKNGYHVRSVSLPCRSISSHPLISQLRDEVNQLKSWATAKNDSRTSAWLCDGLTQLKTVQESLDDLLHLPQTRESLFCGYNINNGLIEKFLDEFLGFLDAYGIFQTLMLTLKQQHSAAQVAVKRRDFFKMSLCSKNFKKMGKDFGHLASSLPSSSMLKFGRPGLVVKEEDGDDQIVQVIKDVIEVTASVSFALFSGLSVSLASPKPITCLKFRLISKKINTKNIIDHLQQQQCLQEGIQEFEEIGLESLRTKDEEELKWTFKRMHELEEYCLNGIENGSERVFRSLFNTRVSLLNVLTPL